MHANVGAGAVEGEIVVEGDRYAAAAVGGADLDDVAVVGAQHLLLGSVDEAVDGCAVAERVARGLGARDREGHPDHDRNGDEQQRPRGEPAGGHVRQGS